MSRNGSPIHRSVFSKLLTVSVAATLAGGVLSAAPPLLPDFGTPYPHPVFGNFVADIATGDLNGDGRTDVVTANNGTTDFGVKSGLGDGSGEFSVMGPFGMGQKVNSVALADLNGDGRLDAVTANLNNYAGSTFSVLLGSGDGSFGGETTYPFTNAVKVATGDIDGDGDADVAVMSGNALSVYRNNGAAVLSPAFSRAYSTPNCCTYSGYSDIAISDVNQDGKRDLAISVGTYDYGGEPQIQIMHGNGDGTFQATTYYRYPNDPAAGRPVGYHTTSIEVADVSGDSRPDLVLGAQRTWGPGRASVIVVMRNQAGAFPQAGGSVHYMNDIYGANTAVGDLNADGAPDIVGAVSNGALGYVLNDGAGNFAATATVLYGMGYVTTVALGDFNSSGAGSLDVIMGRYGAAPITLTHGTPVAPLPTQTLTILGGNGGFGEIAANVEYYNPVLAQWQPSYLVGTHPWGQVAGTSSWINYKPSNGSDPGAGPSTNDTLWFLYRVRFTVPADAVDPKMTFSVKADNFVQVGINGVATGGATTFINHANMPNVITGEADGLNADAVFSQAVHPGENTITLNVGDWGGLNGFNFRIDLTMKSSEGIEIVPVNHDTTAPAIAAPGDITAEATSAAGAAVTFAATATDDFDGSVPVVASPASGSTFPIGVSSVSLTAKDAAGNAASATFNVTVQDTTAPVVNPQASIVAEATSAAGASVLYPDATATDAVGVVTIQSNPPSGSTFPLGSTTVTSTARDAAGNTGAGDFSVTVVDTTAPAIASVAPSQGSLWPPNHRMVGITLTAVSSDAVGVTSTKIISVTSSEADNGLGDGDTAGDFVITGAMSVNLRAERAGKGSGRTYTITVEARDAAGNASTRTTTVFVPKSQGK